MPLKVVALGSGSALKIAAVQQALPIDVTLAIHATALTGVADQPCGRAETAAGARNRAAAARAAFPEADAWIGIENGMWAAADPTGEAVVPVSAATSAVAVERPLFPGAPLIECHNVDAAAVVVLANLRSVATGATASGADLLLEIEEWSDALAIPLVLPFAQGRRGEWSVLKDPHSELTGGRHTRKDFLVPPIARALQRLAAQLGA